jgi:hypothetical protein
MTHKRKGQLTVSGEWAQHLRPEKRRFFWKAERQAGRSHIRTEQAQTAGKSSPPGAECSPGAKPRRPR